MTARHRDLDTYSHRLNRAANIVPDVLAHLGTRAGELIAKFPYAPVDSIVHALETGETRNLAVFAADTQPAPNGNVVDLPARKP